MEEATRSDLEGRELTNVRGERLGKIDALFTYGEVESPNWARVKIGRLGFSKVLVPLENAEESDGKLCLPYETEHVQNAPEVEPEGDQLSDEQVDLLCRHYGLERVAPPSGIAEDDIELSRETRDAKPPALEEDDDSELNQRRRERAKELGVPEEGEEETGSAEPSEEAKSAAEPSGEAQSAEAAQSDESSGEAESDQSSREAEPDESSEESESGEASQRTGSAESSE